MKRTLLVMHEMVLNKAWVRELEAANEALSKRWRAKKRHIWAGGPLSVHEATDTLTDMEGNASSVGGGNTIMEWSYEEARSESMAM